MLINLKFILVIKVFNNFYRGEDKHFFAYKVVIWLLMYYFNSMLR